MRVFTVPLLAVFYIAATHAQRKLNTNMFKKKLSVFVLCFVAGFSILTDGFETEDFSRLVLGYTLL